MGMVNKVENPFDKRSILDPEARHQILVAWNDTEQPYPLDITVEKLFELQADKTPDAPAALIEEVELSYRDLNDRANYLAHRLSSLGVESGQVIGLCFERSLEFLIALFAVLKAGAAFVPLDPAYPVARLKHMLEDTTAKVVLTHTSFAPLLEECGSQRLYLDKFNWSQTSSSFKRFDAGTTADSLMYIMYTSGSTGLPKGVEVPQRGVLNLLHWLQSEYQITPADRVLHKTSIGFDVSIAELFWPLVNGAPIVLARPGGHRDASYLAKTLEEQEITRLFTEPTMLRAMLDNPYVSTWKSIKAVYCTGEALTVEVSEKFHGAVDAELHNLYGPTETTVFSSHWHSVPGAKSISIGRPVANTQVYILDSAGEPVPVGTVGELYIGGDGVAWGYRNLSEQTANSFVSSTLTEVQGEKLYRTGDLARYHPDGTIQHLGRIDQQIKLRGVRIEPGEIESLLNQRSDVRESAVVLKEHAPGDMRLQAFFVPFSEQTCPDPEELRTYLRTQLPEVMVPSLISSLEELPHTLSGKLDRKTLSLTQHPMPRPPLKTLVAGSSNTSKIASIFADILEHESVDVDDSFFGMGGHSLLAIMITNRINSQLKVDLPLSAIFDWPTPAKLAERISQMKNNR